MANIEITQCDVGGIAIGEAIHRDETVTFAAADTFVAGTILARRSVAVAVTASAVTGTGNGTVTAATVVAGSVVPLVGAYVLRCTEIATHGGIFRLEDPNGAIVATDLRLTAGAGVATVFEVAGLTFTITDGSTDFAAGDTATLTVAADGKLVPFDPVGAGGVQVPCAVLTYDLTKAASGDLAARVLVRGEVNATRLVIDAGGTVTAAILDQLRARGITGTSVSQLDALDNE
jgi:hypothetical protein